MHPHVHTPIAPRESNMETSRGALVLGILSKIWYIPGLGFRVQGLGLYIYLEVSGKPSPYSLNPEKTTKGSCLGAPILKTANPEP